MDINVGYNMNHSLSFYLRRTVAPKRALVGLQVVADISKSVTLVMYHTDVIILNNNNILVYNTEDTSLVYSVEIR